MNKIVETFNGTTAERINCRKIKGDFYEMNKQCFLMPDGKWHRINNNKIVFNYSESKYVFIDDDLAIGIVGTEQDGTLKTGHFTKDKNINIELIAKSHKITHCLNREVIEKVDNIKECLSDGTFRTFDSEEDKVQLSRKGISRGYRSRSLDYKCNSHLKVAASYFDKYFKPEEFKHDFYKYLPNVTFGIEVETSNGRISEDLLFKNGLIPVRDGSLRRDGIEPFEYATIILQGKTGLQAVKEQCKLYDKYCEKSYMHSMHIHIGGIELSKEYVYALYLVSRSVQDELYAMFPKSLRKTSTFKQRDYCNELKGFRFRKDDVEYNFDKLYKYLAMTEDVEFEGFKARHPADPNNKAKWNIKTRYSIQNFVSLLFGDNSTMEFRIHTSTFNSDKMANWVFITSAICQYAFNNKAQLSKETNVNLSLNDIMDSIYDESKTTASYLKAYISYRKDLMLQFEKQGDTVGTLDVENDNLNNFDHEIKSLIE